MNTTVVTQQKTDKSEKLKNLATAVYLCQALTFFLAGFPLLLGVAINFYNRNEAQGTWLESHFDWQIKTAWVSLAGFAFAGLFFTVSLEVSVLILLVTLILQVYRIVVGWMALTAEQPIKNIG
ncbi:hypothetical protein JCM14076_13060 [Methylosoma difficile]